MIEYREKVSTTMIYDNLPINDIFRKIDDNTVLGLMDFKGMPQPFFFVLNRDMIICREISKYYEEFIRSEISELGKLDTNIKGEITLVISEKKRGNKFSHLLSESDKRNIGKLINKLSIREIIKLINKENCF